MYTRNYGKKKPYVSYQYKNKRLLVVRNCKRLTRTLWVVDDINNMSCVGSSRVGYLQTAMHIEIAEGCTCRDNLMNCHVSDLRAHSHLEMFQQLVWIHHGQ